MWKYNNNVLVVDEIPLDAIGFIYIIKNNISGRKYIGKKLLTKAGYKTIKGKKKKVRKVSDWENYYSSSPVLVAEIAEIGKESFSREIVLFCRSKSELNYIEEKLQYNFGVLESDNWYNSNIRARIFKKNILNKVSNINEIITKWI